MGTSFFQAPPSAFRVSGIRVGNRGVTLLEVVLAAALAAAFVAAITQFVPKATQAVAITKSRGVANRLALSTLEDLKSRPYAAIPVTPASAFHSGACDCSSSDVWTGGSLSSTTYQSGAIAYAVRACVNYSTPEVQMSGCQAETGRKAVFVNVSWSVGRSSQSLTYQSLAAAPGAVGSPIASTPDNYVTVNVCAADGSSSPTAPANCLGSGASVTSAEIALISNYDGSIYENGHQTASSCSAPYSVCWSTSAPPVSYTLRVQKSGFFPYYDPAVSFSAPAHTYNVILLSTAAYGSKVAGEAFVPASNLITKVIAQAAAVPPGYAKCPIGLHKITSSDDDRTEAIELYNPPGSAATYQFGPNGNSGLVFCGSDPKNCVFQNFSSATFINSSGNWAVAPGQHFLIIGWDQFRHGTTGNTSGLGTTPDISYVVRNFAGHVPSALNEVNPGEGLIPYKTGGGIAWVFVYGSAPPSCTSGTMLAVLDSVRWQGQDGSWGSPFVNASVSFSLPGCPSCAVSCQGTGTFSVPFTDLNPLPWPQLAPQECQ